MNNERLQEILIGNFKKDFKEQCGKGVKVIICNRWQSEANFTDKGNFWAIMKLIFDYTGWDYAGTYPKFQNTVGRPRGDTTEMAFRRALVDYVAVNNGVTLVSIAKETGRSNHTSIISNVESFENRLETEYMVQKLFGEVIAYVKSEYHLYKGRTTLKSEVGI